MWSDWLVFCDCGFHSVCPLMENDMRLMEASWWERLTEGETGSCSDGWGRAQQIFNPIFYWWVGLCSLPVVYLGPNYGGGNEDNGDLLQKVPCAHCYTQCPQLCIRPPLTHASAGDSWTITGKSGSVSCGVTAPFSWVLVRTKFCLCPPRVYFPVLCKTGGSWRRVLTKCGPLEKGMANHFSILSLRTPWTVWKSKNIWHWKMNSPGQ